MQKEEKSWIQVLILLLSIRLKHCEFKSLRGTYVTDSIQIPCGFHMYA